MLSSENPGRRTGGGLCGLMSAPLIDIGAEAQKVALGVMLALNDAAFAAALAEGRAMTLEQAIEYALASGRPSSPV